MEGLKLKPWLLARCESIGIKNPTPVQIGTIPEILKGRDGMGIAETGSGKTMAFALPILNALSEDPYGIFALVLTPTRELAFQIADQFKILGQPLTLSASVIIGGRDMVAQGSELSASPHIVIATPGRLADHLRSNSDSFTLKKIKFLILDEADRLLEGGFDEQLSEIFQSLPKKRQTLLFTATYTDSLKDLLSLNPENNSFVFNQSEITDENSISKTVDTLDQRYVLTPSDFKDAYLVGVLLRCRDSSPKASFIIFAKTCKIVQLLSMTLEKIGFPNVCLHSMKPQKERLSALTNFKSQRVKILVATDVASRGLDIPEVEYVINHNVPTNNKEYVHRVGRTARAGRRGVAITLVTPQDVIILKSVEELIGKKLDEFSVNEKELSEIVVQVNVTRREQDIKLLALDFEEKRKLHKRKNLIKNGVDPDEFEREEKKRRRKLIKERQKNRKEKK